MPEIHRDFTATVFVVQEGRTLLLFHKKLRLWLPPGGHIHPNELPCDAALREVREETGLEVQLLQPRTRLGEVSVLSQPACVLLEKIAEGHEHIDLIYFGRVVGGELTPSIRETDGCRWNSTSELDHPDIAEDIRVLGKKAILAAES